MSKVVNILGDHIGEVNLIDWLGGDLASSNGARASFGREKQSFDEADSRLVERLGKDQHQTPLRHTYIQLHVKAPEFVARQWFKHLVGCEYGFKDLPWSEFSQRYKEVTPEFYVPVQLRGQSIENKQASIENLGKNWLIDRMGEAVGDAWDTYRMLLNAGVAREQARIVLPLATYTEWTWTASIQAVVHFCALRNHPGAQWEIQQYAYALEELVEPLAPYTWASLMKNHPLNLGEKT